VRFRLQHGHGECLLCGEKDPWALGLDFVPDETGGIRTPFKAHPGLQGYNGIVHGGVIAALLDAAMTHCLFHQGIAAVTGDLHVRFVHPVPVDAHAHLHAWIVTSSRRVYRVKAELLCGTEVAAWAEAAFVRHPARPGGDPPA